MLSNTPSVIYTIFIESFVLNDCPDATLVNSSVELLLDVIIKLPMPLCELTFCPSELETTNSLLPDDFTTVHC